jgi:hypothetical protein
MGRRESGLLFLYAMFGGSFQLPPMAETLLFPASIIECTQMLGWLSNLFHTTFGVISRFAREIPEF